MAHPGIASFLDRCLHILFTLLQDTESLFKKWQMLQREEWRILRKAERTGKQHTILGCTLAVEVWLSLDSCCLLPNAKKVILLGCFEFNWNCIAQINI
jgi:hypothetical protein